MAHVPSLLHPPSAPKKKAVIPLHDLEDVPRLDLDFQSNIREGFLAYSKEQVAEENDPEALRNLRTFLMPDSQYISEEEAWHCGEMVAACNMRLLQLQHGMMTVPPRTPLRRGDVDFGLDKIRPLELEPERDEGEEGRPFDYAEWRELVVVDSIRQKFFAITPEDVECERDSDLIKQWLELYITKLHPINDHENLFSECVQKACKARLLELALAPPSSPPSPTF